MFLNKSVLLATITSVPAGMNSILASTRTRTKSLIPAGMEFQYISSLFYLFFLLCLAIALILSTEKSMKQRMLDSMLIVETSLEAKFHGRHKFMLSKVEIMLLF